MSTGQTLPPILEPPNEVEEGTLQQAPSAQSDAEDAGEDTPARSLVDGLRPERALEEGACVCFFTPRGQLLVVRPAGKFWELHAIAIGQTSYDADGTQRVQYYPPEAMFNVIRKGKFIGFRSLAAEGKTLQALGREGAPHRINNHNFGDWESWEQTEEGLLNVKFKKPLGFEVREVRAVAVEDLRGAQKSHLRSVRQWQSKAQNAEVKISESERRVKEVLRSITRQKELHAKELAHLRTRMEEALREKQKHSVENLQTGAAFNQVEFRMKELAAEKNALEAQAALAESKYQSLKREMEVIRERHDGEMHRLELAHSSEMSALIRQKELELKHATQEYEVQLRLLQEELGSKAKKKDNQIEELEGRIGGTLKEKDMQITELLEECSRLHAAMRTIKLQVEQAHVAKASIEAGNMQISLSPVRTSPIMRGSPAFRTSPGLRTWSRTQSRSPTHSYKSGRLSADPVLCADPVTSPIPIGASSAGSSQNYRDSQRTPWPIDRSGARAPTPADDMFPPKDMSPSSATNDGNPPGSDNEPMPELTNVASLAEGFPLSVDSEDIALRQDERQGSGFSLKSVTAESDGDESDGFKSATEEMDGVDGNQKGAAKELHGKKMAGSLRSFPIVDSPDGIF